jgi:co-chaperonin GroES (HSP10)
MTDELTPEQKAKTIPAPTGWKLLCAIPEMDDTFEGTDIVKPDAFIKQEEPASTVLFVVKIGLDAYKDKVKFPYGPWCKEGDFVLVRAYSGTRLKIFDREFRLINDDQVEAVVEDPRGISRA